MIIDGCHTCHLCLQRMLACLLLISCMACSDGSDDRRGQPAVAMENIDQPRLLPTVPLPPVQDDVVHVEHKMIDGRDPFVLPVRSNPSESPVHGPQPETNRPRQILEQFALDELHMVGTLGAGASRQALVQDPEKFIHRVGITQYMGRNHGQVTHIDDDTITLRELMPHGATGWREAIRRIHLADRYTIEREPMHESD